MIFAGALFLACARPAAPTAPEPEPIDDTITLAVVGTAVVGTAPPDAPPAARTVAFQGHIAELSAAVGLCHTERLAADPTLAGRCKVLFTVSDAGHAQNVTVTGIGRADPGLEACVRDVVDGWDMGRREPADPAHRMLVFRFVAE